MKFSSVGLEDLSNVAQAIIDSNCTIFLFEGNLGAGKTTLIKEIGRLLEVTSDMSSPTFSIVNDYDLKSGRMYHFDLYRIENQEELYDIGFEDYLDSGHLCLLEWPEIAADILQHYDTKTISIEINEDESRCIFVT